MASLPRGRTISGLARNSLEMCGQIPRHESRDNRSSRPNAARHDCAVGVNTVSFPCASPSQMGAHRISYHRGIPRSTVERVLACYRMPELVYMDIKKLGYIPEGGGWRAHGRGSAQDRQAGNTRGRAASRGFLFLHHAVNDHSRLAYSEIFNDEKKETAAGFWERAWGFLTAAVSPLPR